jgi:hypothetical protein
VLFVVPLPPAPCVRLDSEVTLPPSRGLLTLAPTSHVRAITSPCAPDWSEGERKEVLSYVTVANQVFNPPELAYEEASLAIGRPSVSVGSLQT